VNTTYQSIAIVDAAATDTIVWQVDVSADPGGLSRMCGAWVFNADEGEKLKPLTEARYLVATPAGNRECSRAGARTHLGHVDLAQTVSAVESEIVCLQALFELEAAKSKSKLVVPAWPRTPKAIDLAHPPVDALAPKKVAPALGIARWLEAMALIWESIEGQRLMRKFMRNDELDQRPFPLVLRDRRETE
jgi:hypothetical protein